MTNQTATTVISWTPQKLEVLRERLKAAKENNEESCYVDGHEIYVAYGEHLVGYLETEFSYLAERI